MASEFLSVFDIPHDAGNALAEVTDGSHLPSDEEARIRSARLLAETHDFDALIACATSIHRSRVIDESDLEGNDLLTSVWRTLQGTTERFNLSPWRGTDRLIAKARYLEREAAASLDNIRQVATSSVPPSILCYPEVVRPVVTKRRPPPAAITSHYWCHTPNGVRPTPETTATSRDEGSNSNLSHPVPAAATHGWNTEHSPVNGVAALQTTIKQVETSTSTRVRAPSSGQREGNSSPYFALPPQPQSEPKPKRPPAGTISCIPFPPLGSTSFGLIQERFAHEPFWLLVAVTFLIRTKGTAAVPVVLTLKDKYPTPEAIADASNARDILDLIRHLGLSKNRMGILQKHARLFINKPPRSGAVYRVKNYDSRDIDLSLVVATSSPEATFESGGVMLPGDTGDDAEAWEIGHMTQGKYAIDSWRIFCRDELLGRAEDWKGTGREPDFQPEWMRVMPEDKELRAYLRWMWMGEGWEWDPLTGDKKPLRGEMMRAVNDGKVEYDDGGGLRIVPG